jgi:hypothetical protein
MKKNIFFFGTAFAFFMHALKKNSSFGSGSLLCIHGCFFIGMFCGRDHAAGVCPENAQVNTSSKKAYEIG